ncbi:PA2169 family four-helix-bundle protein [Skermanella mucosa]|uniref:PA2169 family four-helix-bundle protein n=1 Tax=Skermanella mucosa TaxID=1789672 RepID=UPI00192B7D0E|nr:PA2169 family four-helix-bundle protein [Skermanella mucosa]UEM21901.1 PA2169 family four-helix-bundle protein [Skermanella mucosa]
MNRSDDNDDLRATGRSGTESGSDQGAAGRSPEDIERDIAGIRARMDQTLDELEFRLSPGQLTSGAVDLVKDVMRGNPSRLGDAIRNNPIPVVMIGIGALWLAVAMGRSQQQLRQDEPEGRRISRLTPADISDVLSPLIAVTLQGVDGLRQAETKIADPKVQAIVREIAQQHDRAAAALEEEVRRHGAVPQAGTTPPGRLHPAWSELRRALVTGETSAIIAGIENGEDSALEAFRMALHADLPEETRVLVGAHFHAIQQIHNRMSALKGATT